MKIFIQALCVLISIVLIILSITSNIVTVTGFDLSKWVKTKSPESIIIIGLIFCLYASGVYIKYLKNQNDKLTQKIKEVPYEENLCEADKSLLTEFSTFFDEKFHGFTELILEFRQVDFNKVNFYDTKINYFLSPLKKFKNKRLEESKIEFLNSFSAFMDYFSQHNTITSHYTLLRFKPNSDEEEQEYLKLLDEFFLSWERFLDIVREESPNFFMSKKNGSRN
ncbi:hypothetical protein [Bacillus halotolerans]|uniref:hypothetical protein n=1 Tax=Bacillus halotolerans TaxID=260554 RepID=UPI0033058EF5